MKITQIRIKNYRAFHGNAYTIYLPNGENLIVFGENGSGKSSLYAALRDFFTVDKSVMKINEPPYRNFFATKEETLIKIKFSDNKSYEWSNKQDTTPQLAKRGIDTTKGFVDYKSLLQTYYAQQKANTVNVFNFLIEEIFSDLKPVGADWTFGEKWKEILDNVPKEEKRAGTSRLTNLIEEFNNALARSVKSLETEAQKILNKFEMNVKIELNAPGVNYNKDRRDIEDRLENRVVKLIVDFFGKRYENHHNLLNEARLSAIAISVFFASFKLQPSGIFKFMVLDDMLIGLDMANRFPILEILDEMFSEFQIFLFTFDKFWYHALRARYQSATNKWQSLEFYASNQTDRVIMLVRPSHGYLEKAKEQQRAANYEAAANLTRSFYEELIKDFCDHHSLEIPYSSEIKKLNAQKFWLKTKEFIMNQPSADQTIIGEVEMIVGSTLHSLSHAGTSPVTQAEVKAAIATMEKLDRVLRGLKNLPTVL
jgi:ABC-type multidrug transport system fused ATPase/permease subunit